MAQVYRPVYTVTDPATGKKSKRKSRTWHVRYWTPAGERVRVKGYRDKKATENLAAELERRAIRLDAGMVDPCEEHAKRPLAEHAEDFRRYLAAKGNRARYVRFTLFRLTAVLDECRFAKIGDLQASAVVEFLARLRDAGKGTKTVNEYLAAAEGFTHWLCRDRRLAVDPSAYLSKLAHAAADVRHARRDLSPEKLRCLLETARSSARPFRKLYGPDRYTIYLTAAATGFRTSELASMTPESFDLDSDTPTATVQAACTKNRKLAVQPLPVDVAAVLRDYLRGMPVGVPVWPGTWSKDASGKMIRRDLSDARAAWLQSFQGERQRGEMAQSDFLAYRDAQGRVIDFHALWHTFITMVGKAGVSAREHMDLARHSSYAMTARYSHPQFYDLAAAVQSLPILAAGPEAQARALAATGTDGGPKYLGPNLGPQSAKTGDFEPQTEAQDNEPCEAKNPGKPAVFGVFRGTNTDASTVAAAGFEPATSRL